MKIKKYTVFVSSHFKSLKEERNELINCLMDAQFFPICMEHFIVPSSEKFEGLKKLIDQSDVFVMMLGDKYGSCDENGISWTEREFRYASETGKKIFVIKTQKYVALEKKSRLYRNLLSEDQKKQIAFGEGIPYAHTVTKETTVQRIVMQISGTKFDDSEGWERWSPKALKEWQDKNRSFDMRGEWFHVHFKENDKEYVRVGSVHITQEFDPENYTHLNFNAVNYSVLSYNPTDMSIKTDPTRKTIWNGDYVLDRKDGTILGAYKTKRFFREQYGDWVVEMGQYMGIHELSIVDADHDKDPSDETAVFSGSFNDIKPSPKMGFAVFYRTKTERDKFVLERFKDVLKIEQ